MHSAATLPATFLGTLPGGGLFDFHVLAQPAGLTALLTLTLMEVILGIDNVVFIAILVGKLPKHQQRFARNLGMALALVCRLGLLFSISWVMRLTKPLFSVTWGAVGLDHGFSGRDLILLGGGLFLIGKASTEIYHKLEGDDHAAAAGGAGTARFGPMIFQIILLDLVFSLDSVITAVGMARSLLVMVLAMFVAVGVMVASAGLVGDFVHRHPSVKILALSFLNLIGVMLLVEGMGGHMNKGYIYSAMAFSLLVEFLNMRLRRKSPPVELRDGTDVLRT
ncbi:MAG: TerC family protein [Candidatus Brocadiae bacterium]|nr:TerC family protein [Candidatus Brocadiia bacterium]